MCKDHDRGGDEGFTLVELLVSIVLLGVLGAITLTAVINTQKDYRLADDQAQGLSDVKVASERLARDVRDARGIVCDGAASDPTCTRHLQIWIDSNSNYLLDPGETVTWSLQPEVAGAGVCGPTGHCDLIRSVAGSSQVEARTIVTNVAFGYDVAPTTSFTTAGGAAHTSLVNTTMTYDALTRTGGTPKTVSFSARLRNVS